MGSSSTAAWMARGLSFAGLIATVLSAFGHEEFTQDQINAISAVIGFVIVVAWPAYEKFHATAKAHTEALSDANKTLSAAAGLPPMPASGTVSTLQTGASK